MHNNQVLDDFQNPKKDPLKINAKALLSSFAISYLFINILAYVLLNLIPFSSSFLSEADGNINISFIFDLLFRIHISFYLPYQLISKQLCDTPIQKRLGISTLIGTGLLILFGLEFLFYTEILNSVHAQSLVYSSILDITFFISILLIFIGYPILLCLIWSIKNKYIFYILNVLCIFFVVITQYLVSDMNFVFIIIFGFPVTL